MSTSTRQARKATPPAPAPTTDLKEAEFIQAIGYLSAEERAALFKFLAETAEGTLAPGAMFRFCKTLGYDDIGAAEHACRWAEACR